MEIFARARRMAVVEAAGKAESAGDDEARVRLKSGSNCSVEASSRIIRLR